MNKEILKSNLDTAKLNCDNITARIVKGKPFVAKLRDNLVDKKDLTGIEEKIQSVEEINLKATAYENALIDKMKLMVTMNPTLSVFSRMVIKKIGQIVLLICDSIAYPEKLKIFGMWLLSIAFEHSLFRFRSVFS